MAFVSADNKNKTKKEENKETHILCFQVHESVSFLMLHWYTDYTTLVNEHSHYASITINSDKNALMYWNNEFTVVHQ